MDEKKSHLRECEQFPNSMTSKTDEEIAGKAIMSLRFHPNLEDQVKFCDPGNINVILEAIRESKSAARQDTERLEEGLELLSHYHKLRPQWGYPDVERFAQDVLSSARCGLDEGEQKKERIVETYVISEDGKMTVESGGLELTEPVADNAETVLQKALQRLSEINHDLWAEEGVQWRHDLHKEADEAIKQLLSELDLISWPHKAEDASKQKDAPYDYAPWSPPFRYVAAGSHIVDSTERLILDVRGWGMLTGMGSDALGLDLFIAAAIQDQLGQHVTKLLNLTSVGRGTEAGAAPLTKDSNPIL